MPAVFGVRMPSLMASLTVSARPGKEGEGGGGGGDGGGETAGGVEGGGVEGGGGEGEL